MSISSQNQLNDFSNSLIGYFKEGSKSVVCMLMCSTPGFYSLQQVYPSSFQSTLITISKLL